MITFAQSRAPARAVKPWPGIDEQDTTLWDRELIREGESLLKRAYALGAPLGRFQLEAAIQSLHCDRARTGELDVGRLVALYRGLVAIAPTSGARRALAAAIDRSSPRA
jgi:RNA polymerase sigma-70 factor (ECF subfamily)